MCLSFMRLFLISLVACTTLACTKSEEERERRRDDEHVVKKPVAPGIISGTATASAIPGVEPGPGEPSRSVPWTKPCEVTASTADRIVARAMTNEKGEYELRVPPGQLNLSFAACKPDICMAQTERSITIASGETKREFFHCEGGLP